VVTRAVRLLPYRFGPGSNLHTVYGGVDGPERPVQHISIPVDECLDIREQPIGYAGEIDFLEHRLCGCGGRCRVVSDEQAIDIVDWADGGDKSSLAEADLFVDEVRDFNAEALPRDDNGQAACCLTAVALVEAFVRRDQDLTSEVGCNQHGRM